MEDLDAISCILVFDQNLLVIVFSLFLDRLIKPIFSWVECLLRRGLIFSCLLKRLQFFLLQDRGRHLFLSRICWSNFRPTCPLLTDDLTTVLGHRRVVRVDIYDEFAFLSGYRLFNLWYPFNLWGRVFETVHWLIYFREFPGGFDFGATNHIKQIRVLLALWYTLGFCFFLKLEWILQA